VDAFESEDDVREDADLGRQRVVLEHHGQAALFGREVPLLVRYDAASDRDAARACPVDPGHEPQLSFLDPDGPRRTMNSRR
jgi:hypothetical protein